MRPLSGHRGMTGSSYITVNKIANKVNNYNNTTYCTEHTYRYLTVNKIANKANNNNNTMYCTEYTYSYIKYKYNSK